MTGPKDFDSRLRTYLSEGARAKAPSGMESRVERRLLGPRRDVSRQILGAAAIVVLAIGLAIGGRALRQAQQGLAAPTASPLISPSASAPAPSGKPSPQASPTPNAAEPYPLIAPASMHMVSATTGWAAGAATDRILRTSDGGQHWSDVTPEGARRGTWTTFFADADQAWLASSLQPGSSSGDFTAQIYRTADGGKTWAQAGVVNADWGWPAAIDFVDQQRGWVFMKQEGTLEPEGSDLVAFYGTTDGGATWAKLSEAGAGSGQAPVSCSKGEPIFLNATTGWLSGGCTVEANRPYLYVTRDGARSWHEANFSLPAGWPATCLCSVDSLRFSDARNGVFVLTIYLPEGASQSVLYRTSDAGQTWRIGPRIPDQVHGLYFVDLVHGWALNEKARTVLSTSDGGAHWSMVGRLPSPMGPIDLEFKTTATGWLLGMEPKGRPIFKTVDGGANWTAQLSP